jgi:hypothetical protein
VSELTIPYKPSEGNFARSRADESHPNCRVSQIVGLPTPGCAVDFRPQTPLEDDRSWIDLTLCQRCESSALRATGRATGVASGRKSAVLDPESRAHLDPILQFGCPDPGSMNQPPAGSEAGAERHDRDLGASDLHSPWVSSSGVFELEGRAPCGGGCQFDLRAQGSESMSSLVD